MPYEALLRGSESKIRMLCIFLTFGNLRFPTPKRFAFDGPKKIPQNSLKNPTDFWSHKHFVFVSFEFWSLKNLRFLKVSIFLRILRFILSSFKYFIFLNFIFKNLYIKWMIPISKIVILMSLDLIYILRLD